MVGIEGDPKKWIKGIIIDFINTSPSNNIQNDAQNRAWDQALVGFASGADPIWTQYKEYVGPFHWTPWEVFYQHQPGQPVKPEELTVISWILPQRELARKANRQARKYPAPEWARVKVYGERCNVGLRNHVKDSLEAAGHPAVAPALVPNWTKVKSEKYSWASSWSERHAAYAAGLGTFSLSDGLITAKGKALRADSVVAKIDIEAAPRPYNHHRAYCLFYVNGSCGKCIDRCPARAISINGLDKERCLLHLTESRQYIIKNYGIDCYDCGLCQVGVPCETRIPVKAAREAMKKGELL